MYSSKSNAFGFSRSAEPVVIAWFASADGVPDQRRLRIIGEPTLDLTGDRANHGPLELPEGVVLEIAEIRNIPHEVESIRSRELHKRVDALAQPERPRHELRRAAPSPSADSGNRCR